MTSTGAREERRSEPPGGVAAISAGRLPPEAQVAFFAFLLNYPWEMLQTPFFQGMAEMRHWDAVRECSRATVGDAGLLVLCFWAGAIVQRSRGWMARPRPAALATFLVAGVIATIVLEWLATEVLQRWEYAPEMPTLPLFGTGLAPLLQWLILPPLLIWICRRQLQGAAAVASGASSAAREEV